MCIDSRAINKRKNKLTIIWFIMPLNTDHLLNLLSFFFYFFLLLFAGQSVSKWEIHSVNQWVNQFSSAILLFEYSVNFFFLILFYAVLNCIVVIIKRVKLSNYYSIRAAHKKGILNPQTYKPLIKITIIINQIMKKREIIITFSFYFLVSSLKNVEKKEFFEFKLN